MTRLAAIATVLLISSAIVLVTVTHYSAQRRFLYEQERNTVLRLLSNVRGRLENAINSTFLLVNGMVAYVSVHPNLTEHEFETFARELMRGNVHIRNVTLAPNNIIRYVYPLAGNESILGFDIMTDPIQRETAERVMNERTTVIAGPFTLVQGDVAIVNRTPIFTQDESGIERYWGLTSIPIVMESVFAYAGVTEEIDGIRIGIRGRNGRGAAGEHVWGSEDVFQSQPEILEVTLPGGTWQIGAAPIEGWYHDDPRGILWVGAAATVVFATLAGLLLAGRAKLAQLNRKMREYFAVVDDYVITSTTDTAGIIIDVSEAFCRVSGYTKQELIGRSHNVVRHPDVPPELYRDLWDTIQAGRPWQGEIKNRTKTGGYYWVDVRITPVLQNGKIVAYTAVRQDITNSKRIEELSIRDELTGLFNRRHFNTVFPQECARARRDDNYLTLVIIDVDHFKQYNDHYGHQAGDEALQKIGTALAGLLLRASDFAFRLGGEEFGLLFSGLELDESHMYLQRIIDAVRELNIRHEYCSTGPVVSASAGYVTYRGTEIDAVDSIYKAADDALYCAKHEGRNRVVRYNAG